MFLELGIERGSGELEWSTPGSDALQGLESGSRDSGHEVAAAQPDKKNRLSSERLRLQ